MNPLDWLFSTFYDTILAPCEARGLGAWRTRTLAGFTGDVLDLGAGTGVNLRHFPQDVRLTLVEPSPGMRARLTERAAGDPRVVAVIDASAEDLPFPDASFDGVALGLVLCSVPDPARALAEVRRVLRPGGQLAFVEHVGARTPGLARVQRLIEPAWTVCGRGCRLTRDTERHIAEAGFTFEHLSRDDIPHAFPLIRPAIHGVAR